VVVYSGNEIFQMQASYTGRLPHAEIIDLLEHGRNGSHGFFLDGKCYDCQSPRANTSTENEDEGYLRRRDSFFKLCFSSRP
jgi:hypothetical protein